MICDKCHGELFADREAGAYVAQYGYLGGRVHCMAGCTSIWLLKRADGSERVIPRDGRGQRHKHKFRCVDCRQVQLTRSYNTKRCKGCNVILHRKRAAAAQRRYARRIA